MLRRRIGHSHIIAVAVAIWSVSLITSGTASQDPPVVQSQPQQIDFNWDIRPILSDNCYQCHGPSATGRQANLRLDTPEGAYAERGTTERPRWPIVPGNAAASEIMRRVTAPIRAVQMPPESTNKTLTDSQVELLREWIAQGATNRGA
jgi:hypothetical protein